MSRFFNRSDQPKFALSTVNKWDIVPTAIALIQFQLLGHEYCHWWQQPACLVSELNSFKKGKSGTFRVKCRLFRTYIFYSFCGLNRKLSNDKNLFSISLKVNNLLLEQQSIILEEQYCHPLTSLAACECRQRPPFLCRWLHPLQKLYGLKIYPRHFRMSSWYHQKWSSTYTNGLQPIWSSPERYLF